MQQITQTECKNAVWNPREHTGLNGETAYLFLSILFNLLHFLCCLLQTKKIVCGFFKVTFKN